jgi:oligopeptide transport system substrate-binding protein
MENKLLRCLLLLVIASCTCNKQGPAPTPTSSVDNTKTFIVNVSPGNVAKDPLIVLDQERLKILSLVFEPLLSYAASGEIVPVLVSELPTLSADQLTYNFKLKAINFRSKDLNRAITSKDVVQSLLRGAADEDASNYGSLLKGLISGLKENKEAPSGIVIKSPNEFSIKLTRKYPDFLALLTLPAFSVVPAELISNGKISKAVGTGPYAFNNQEIDNKEWDLQGDATLKFPTVHVTQSFEVADVNAADYSSLPLKVAAEAVDPGTGALKKMPGSTLQELRLRRLEILVFNLSNPLVKSLGVDFRKAVMSVLDLKSILNSMYRGFSFSSAQFIPPGVEGSLAETTFVKFSAEEAKKKIAKALKNKKFKIKFPETSAYWVGALQKSLEDYANYFEFESVEPTTYLNQVEKGDFQLAPLSWEGDLPEATNFLQLYYSGSHLNAQNLARYKSPAFDSLFDKLSKLFPSAERKNLAEDAHKLVLRDLPAIPLGFKKEFCVLSARAANLNTKTFGASALKDFLLAP